MPNSRWKNARKWRALHIWQDNEWDEKMKREIANGKLEKLLAKVDEDIAGGKLNDLP